jgi:hypothetical protein
MNIASLRRLLLATCAVLLLASAAIAEDAPLRIGTIRIQALDVYSPVEAMRGSFYRLTDRLHFNTRPSLVRGFLLFKEGDPYVPEKLAETERNLRALSFMKSAKVTAEPPHDGVVDVTVVTQDAWSLEPGSEAGSKGGVTTFGLSLTDTNLAGWGRQVGLSYNKGVTRSRAAIDYRDPAFPRPYWQTRLTWAQNSDGFERTAGIIKPFYSFATPTAFTFFFTNVRQSDTLYGDAQVSEIFKQHHHEAIASYGLALAPNDDVANRLTFGFHYLFDDFGTLHHSPDEALPDTREFHYLFSRYEHVDNRFVTLDYVDRDQRLEDFNLGNQFAAELGLSPKSFGSPSTSGLVRISEARGFVFGPRSFVIPQAGFEGRLDNGLQNGIFSAGAKYVHRFDTAFPQSLVGRVIVDSGWRLDRDLQFFADGGNGLRAYRLHSFEGNKNIVMNLEQRVYLGRELLQLVSPGVVAFIDAGNATYGGFTQLMRLKTDIGIGFRLGLPRTPKNLLRIDLAMPLNRDPLGRRGLVVSFSSGQAF